ncbi:HYR domain-containing protein [Ilumatobacter coccineus]|uniref:HYR domain-containing protein n=1 Tax=Ilumatobacter coccineus (strain NBRC 103263 / KCTC 29153 / YM16-304) TaxID=1313172 RepID=A0A6C7EIR7_ILUCY|nr:HYR domain-containing protein [Ilumatobacter coccineus]BAN03866.1 hypothetical protein YM304_35520 [Ilumatobacter coccineus YM16-304]
MSTRPHHPVSVWGRIAVAMATAAALIITAAPTLQAETSQTVTGDEILGPGGSAQFGSTLLVLSNGNYVVTDPMHDGAFATDIGAIYLYDGTDDSVISRITGTQSNDRVGNGLIAEVGDSNVVVVSRNWANGATPNAGAATWIDGVTGLNGTVAPSNSLVGEATGDAGDTRITVLANGNGLVSWRNWDRGGVVDAGAVTWVPGNTGISGPVSASNSLVGSGDYDRVGGRGVAVLTNGNYVVASPDWDGGGPVERIGAATWGDGAVGATGEVSAANSLVGSTIDDRVGIYGITALANGHYVVASGWWDGPFANVGAVTWGDGESGLVGVVSAANSTIGQSADDSTGTVTALSNGHYTVSSPLWDDGSTENVGAVTWVDGSGPSSGVVTSSNSLIGSTSGDEVGTATALTNGNYVVTSVEWSNGSAAGAGAATWRDGSGPAPGVVSVANSLVGGQTLDRVGMRVTPLTNGNYVVESAHWANGANTRAGAATWGSGTSGVAGLVSPSNSFVGVNVDDFVPRVIVPLTNGNYLISSPHLDSFGVTDSGAVTWADGEVGVVGSSLDGTVSLYGDSPNDLIGSEEIPEFHDIVALPNGNAIVVSSDWDSDTHTDAGAITWIDGTTGLAGPVSASNSLIGPAASYRLGQNGPNVIESGDVIAASSFLDGRYGATLMVGDRPTVGVATESNTAFGSGAGLAYDPQPLLTSDDAVLLRTINNRVFAVRIDRGPEFTSVGANISVTAASGASTAAVSFTTPTAFDLRDDTTSSVACLPASGSAFPIGTTTVTCTATDAGGLTSETTFDVTVVGPAASEIVSLTPGRVFASRSTDETVDGLFEGEGRIAGGDVVEVDIAGRSGVAGDAKAVVMNVTAINPSGRGYVTVSPCGDRPLASSLNYGSAGAVVGNELVAKLSGTGSVCVFTSAETDLTIDVVGYVPSTSGVVSVDPARVYATRASDETVDGEQEATGRISAGESVEVDIVGRAGVPGSGVGAVVMNITAVNPSGRGYVTVSPCGDRPLASSLNYGSAGAVVGNELVAKLSADGTVCVFSSASTDLTVDVVGYVPSSSAARSLDPARVYATRSGDATVDGDQQGVGRVVAGSFVEVDIAGRAGVPASGVGAVVMNITAVNPSGRGYVTVSPCGDRPLASSLNYGSAGAVVGNELVAKLSADGTVCVFSSAATDLTVDVVGYIPT